MHEQLLLIVFLFPVSHSSSSSRSSSSSYSSSSSSAASALGPKKPSLMAKSIKDFNQARSVKSTPVCINVSLLSHTSILAHMSHACTHTRTHPHTHTLIRALLLVYITLRMFFACSRGRIPSGSHSFSVHSRDSNCYLCIFLVNKSIVPHFVIC